MRNRLLYDVSVQDRFYDPTGVSRSIPERFAEVRMKRKDDEPALGVRAEMME